MNPRIHRALSFCLSVWAASGYDAAADVTLAEGGKARAVIVAENWAPEAAASIAQLTVSSRQRGDLLDEKFAGALGESIESRGWTHSEGTYVISYNGKDMGYATRARARGDRAFQAVAEKDLVRPHTITAEAPLTLEYVLSLPADTSRESWAYARVHTADGKRWSHGITARDGQVYFALTAEPADPDRHPIPADAGKVLDLKMEIHPKTVRWYWRNHGIDAPYQQLQSWGIPEPPTITGVRISTKNLIGNSQRERASLRFDAATSDLKKYLDAATGANFKIASEQHLPFDTTKILIGDSPTARALAPDVDWDRLRSDQILIRTTRNHLILAGGKPRGQVYAIYTFLTDIVGIRWWAPGELTIPDKSDLSVPYTYIRYEPPFKLRVHSSTNASSQEARSWLRLSFDVNFDWGTHSIPHLLPRKLFLEHPDWFMYCKDDGDENAKYGYLATLKSFQKTIETETERDDLDIIRQYIEIGRRTRHLPQQPCLHSEGARQMITKNLFAELERDYPKWKYPEKIAWVTQNDGANFCQCDKCEATREEEGSDSANWLLMINEIAEKVEGKVSRRAGWHVRLLAHRAAATDTAATQERADLCAAAHKQQARFGVPLPEAMPGT